MRGGRRALVMLKIGISACFFHADPKRALFKGMTLQYIEQNMAHWVMQRDALALMIPSPDGTTRRSGSAVTVDDYARELDGLLLMGGSDVCPESYGEAALRPEWSGDRVRDDYEMALLRAFVAEGKPVLGVCRGAQIINVAQGGTLYQDIATQRPGALDHRDWEIYAANFHSTAIVPGTGLAALYPGSRPDEDQFGPPSGRQGCRPGPRRRSLVRARPNRRGAALVRALVRVRRAVASRIPRSWRWVLARRHADSR